MVYIRLFIIFIILIIIGILSKSTIMKYIEKYSPNQIQQVNIRPQPIPLTSQ